MLEKYWFLNGFGPPKAMRVRAKASDTRRSQLRFTSVWESENCWFLNGFVCSGGVWMRWKSQNCWFLNGFVCSGGVDCGKVLVFEWFCVSWGCGCWKSIGF